MTRSVSAFILGVLLVCAVEASAKDYGPLPGWARYLPNTTYTYYDFDTDQLPVWPSDQWSPNGEPVLEFTLGDWQWSNGWACGPSLEDLPGSGVCDGWHANSQAGPNVVTITIQNTDDPNEVKNIFLQITSTQQPTGITVTGTGSATEYTPGTFPTGRPNVQEGGPVPFPGGSWYTYNYGLTLRPNPKSEEIRIEVPYCTVIDQIVIDTECVPEPATLLLVALGGLAMIRRRDTN